MKGRDSSPADLLRIYVTTNIYSAPRTSSIHGQLGCTSSMPLWMAPGSVLPRLPARPSRSRIGFSHSDDGLSLHKNTQCIWQQIEDA